MSHVHGLYMAGFCRDVHDLKSSCLCGISLKFVRLPSLQNIGKQQTLEYHHELQVFVVQQVLGCNSFIVSFTQPRSDHRNKSVHFLLGKKTGIFAPRFPTTWHDHVVWNQPQGDAPRARKNPLPFVPRLTLGDRGRLRFCVRLHCVSWCFSWGFSCGVVVCLAYFFCGASSKKVWIWHGTFFWMTNKGQTEQPARKRNSIQDVCSCEPKTWLNTATKYRVQKSNLFIWFHRETGDPWDKP